MFGLRSRCRRPPVTYSVQLQLSAKDLGILDTGAKDSGLPIDVFIGEAIHRSAYLARQRRKGKRILVSSATGTAELIL